VNVTPDKRTIFHHREKVLLAKLRTALFRLYDPSTTTLECNRSVFDAFKPHPECGRAMGAIADESFDKGKLTLSGLKRAYSAHEHISGHKAKRAEALSIPANTSHKIGRWEQESFQSKDTSKAAFVDVVEDVAHVVDVSSKRLSRKERIIPFSLHYVRSASEEEEESAGSAYRRFLAGITPEEGKQAEIELTRNIAKEDFLAMKVVGQFNRGFIVARLREDLFIMDQHASDEKFNFERLEKADLLEGQNMVVPQPLELTAVNEAILRDNMAIFRRNGFAFTCCEHGVSLRRVPRYRNWSFGKADVEELLFMLAEDDDRKGALRPSRVREMLASRACRTSVMIGTPLNSRQMLKLLHQMASMDHPWNCPHGRPTMRHLVSLAVFT